jgi:hypothetical protein
MDQRRDVGKKVMKPRAPVDRHNRMAGPSVLSIPAHRRVSRAGDITIPMLLIVANTTPRHRLVPHSPLPIAPPSRTASQQRRRLRRGVAFNDVIEWEVELLRRHARMQSSARYCRSTP